jgi:hypothetical protein
MPIGIARREDETQIPFENDKKGESRCMTKRGNEQMRFGLHEMGRSLWERPMCFV